MESGSTYLVALTQASELPPFLALKLLIEGQDVLLINQIDKCIAFVRWLLVLLQIIDKFKRKARKRLLYLLVHR